MRWSYGTYTTPTMCTIKIPAPEATGACSPTCFPSCPTYTSWRSTSEISRKMMWTTNVSNHTILTRTPDLLQRTPRRTWSQPNKGRSQEDWEEDKRRGRDAEVDFSGIRVALRAVGRLVNLTGLEILADFFSLRRDRRVQRFCPYFVNICEQLPNLTQLTHLRIRGFSSHEDEDYTQPLEQCLVDRDPPSLKTLVLELPSSWMPFSAISWLLIQQQTNKLENLLIKFTEDRSFDTLPFLGETIAGSFMPRLRNLRIEYPDNGLLSNPRFGKNILKSSITTSFLGNMPALRSLHLPWLFIINEGPSYGRGTGNSIRIHIGK